jgi:hypothetical protein
MRHRPRHTLGSLIFTSMILVAPSGASESVEWPTRWRVNGNGVTGSLEFTVDREGRLAGSLLNDSVEGFVSGRHLLIRRSANGRLEIWEGWLADPRAEDPAATSDGSDRFVAGTYTITGSGQTTVHPWYGRPEPGESSAADSPATADAPLVAHVPSPAEAASPAPSTASTDPLSGTWTSITGERAEIVQDGKSLTVVLADGSSHSGRMTGESGLVVGLRQGCCNGKLEGPNVIVWSDGARWQRAD